MSCKLCQFILALCCFALSNQVIYSQMLTNEISHTNIATISDEDDDFEDWIELYFSLPVDDLSTYFLSDDAGELNKWP